MRGRRTATTLVCGLLLLWVASPAYAAAGDPVTGYWSRTRTGLPVPLQPPDPVPAGGTWVSSDPSGPVAVSALRAGLPERLVALELRLRVADLIGTPAVLACPTLDRWPPEQGGRLEAAPAADCSAPLATRLEQDVLIVPLPPGLGQVELLLTPAPGSAFSLTLERATAVSVVTTRGPSVPAPPARPGPPAPPALAGPAAPPLPISGGDLRPLPGPSTPVVQPPTIAAESSPLLVPPVALTVALPQAAPAPAPVLADRRALVHDRPQTLLAAGLLTLLGALAIKLARQPATAPRALGGSARRSRPEQLQPAHSVLDPTSRGVGRFRSTRTRPPVRL